MQPRSQDSGLNSGWSICSDCSTATAMILQFRWSRRLLTISWTLHRGSGAGLGQRAGSEPCRRPCSSDRRHLQRVLAESLICRSEKPGRGVEPEGS